jgi:hypothetical protein
MMIMVLAVIKATYKEDLLDPPDPLPNREHSPE